MLRYLFVCLWILSALWLMPLHAENQEKTLPVVESQEKTLSVAENGIVDNEYVLVVNCHLEIINWRYNYEDEIVKYVGGQEGLYVYTEHIKTLDITDKDMLEQKCNALLKKYDRRPKVLVLIGPAAYLMFAPAFNKHWKDVPMLYLGPKKKETNLEDLISQREMAFDEMKTVDVKAMQEQYNITGIWSHFYIKETLNLMKRTIEGMNHLVWIGDNRQGSIVARMQAKAALAEYFPDLTVDYISPDRMNTNALLKEVGLYDSHTGILFHSWYMSGDNSEEYYLSNNLYKMLGGFTSAPIFTLWDMNTEMGYIAGGHFIPLKEQSVVAVKLLKQILAGEQARKIPFVELEGDTDCLNYTNLIGFHRNNILLPDGVVYFQKPDSFFFKYRYQLLCVCFVILLLLTYVLYRMRLIKNTQQMQQRELEREKELHKEIGIRNFKLALSLEVSTVRPWMLDLTTRTVYYDDVKNIIDNPQSNVAYHAYSEEEMLSWMEPEDAQKFSVQLQRLADGITPYFKCDYKMKQQDLDKEENWYTMQAVVYERDAYGKPITLIGTAMKITESKEVEIELKEAMVKAEESNRLKSAFLANMSHEIRTPLNAIVGFSGIIAQSNDLQEKKELIAIIEHNNALLLTLINNILDLSKMESGAVNVVEGDFDVNKVITQLRSNYLSILPRTVNLIDECELKTAMMRSDKRLIMQVLDNLLSNAVKFTKNGQIRIGYYSPENDRIRFYVKDTGCGIPQNKLKTIFGRFVKLNNFEQGTGLGLSICQVIAEKMNGQIGVFSEMGKGSEFWFEIPYKVADTVEEPDADVKKEQDGKNDTVIILIAEDDESNYIILQSMLKKGYRLIHAWNGEEAVEYFKKYNPDLILMDVKMPVKDGYEATTEIRKLSSTVPIIAITAYSFDENQDRMFESGFNAYEPKPINRNALKNRITGLLNKK